MGAQMKKERLALHDSWLEDIVEHVKNADTLERRAALLTMYREHMYILYLRLDDYDSVLLYRKHMDAYAELTKVTE